MAQEMDAEDQQMEIQDKKKLEAQAQEQ